MTDDDDERDRLTVCMIYCHAVPLALRRTASCVMLRQKRRNMPHGAARHRTTPQRNASGVNEP